MDLLCGCPKARSARTFHREFFRRIATETPHETPEVHGRAEKRARRPFGEEPAQASLSRAPPRRLPQGAESPREPVPESHQQLRAPAPERAPAFGVEIEAETPADLGLAHAFKKVEPERLKDGSRCVPAARMEMVTEHADRVLAAAAEVAPYDRDGLQPCLHDPEHLPAIRPVADNPEPLPGHERELAAQRTTRWPQILHRGKTRCGEKLLDAIAECLYDHHGFEFCGEARSPKSVASPLF
jgi:hypothetical protein